MKISNHQITLDLVMLFLLILLTSACGPMKSQTIVAVTPLPDEALTPTVTASIATAPTSMSLPTETPVPVTEKSMDEPEAVEQEPTPEAESTLVPESTPTPLNNQLVQGQAAAIALATDVAMQPDIETPIEFDESPVLITFDEFYNGFNLRTGLVLSDKLKSLDGQEVVMEGYMAPPLKPALDWFVLTRIRLEFCPFCSSTADWPDDIALVYLSGEAIVATQEPIRIRGRMEIGSSVDAETGMVSIVRIYAEQIEKL
ncbi:MAG: hypothetical protein AAF639_38555 [Chloroflexota bacterium]